MKSALRSAVCLAVVVTASTFVAAQESRPDQLPELRPILVALRTGAPDAAKTQTVIEQLVKTGHLAAANWWAVEAEAAIKAKKLPATLQACVSSARKSTLTLGAADADRTAATKYARHAEALLLDRNFDEARKVLTVIDALVAVVPDPAVIRSAGELKLKLAESVGNNDLPNLQRRQREARDLDAAVRALVAARIEQLFVEYEAAGCRAGRSAINACLASYALCVDPAVVPPLLVRLNALARRVERPRALRLVVGSVDRVTFFRDGAPLGVRGGRNDIPACYGDVIELPVIDGDLIQLVLNPYSQQRGTIGPTYVFAMSAAVDGVALGPKAWARNAAGTPETVQPSLIPLPQIVCTRDPEKFRLSGLPFPPKGGFIFPRSAGGIWIPLTGEVEEVEAVFAKLKLKPLWLGFVTERCVAVLKVPAGE